MTDTLLSSLTTEHRPADMAASVVASELHAAEQAMDAFIGRLGNCLTSMADGRSKTGVRADRGQKPLEKYMAMLSHATATRGALIDLHGSLAREGRRAQVDWTLILGPGETTPTEGEKDGFPRQG